MMTPLFCEWAYNIDFFLIRLPRLDMGASTAVVIGYLLRTLQCLLFLSVFIVRRGDIL